MADSAVLSVWDALAIAISQGVGVPPKPNGAPLLGNPRFYRLTAPADATLGYYLLGQTLESEAGFYGQPGQDGRYRIHCWNDTPTNANRMYRWLKQQLHDRPLPLDDYAMVRGSLIKLGDQSDQDTKAWQVIAEYAVLSLEQ